MNFTKVIFFTLLLLLPTQLGLHFWLPESLVLGRKIDYLSPTIFLTDIVLILFVCAVWLNNLVTSKKTWTLSVITGGFLWFVMSNIGPLSAYALTRVILLVLFGIAVVRYRPSEREYVLPLTLGSIGLGLIAVAQFVNQQSLGHLFYLVGERRFTSTTPGIALFSTGKLILLRAYTTFPHPNVLGGYTATIAPLLFFSSFFKPSEVNRSKIVFVLKHALVVSVIFALTLSFSRGAWLAALAGIGLWIALLKPRHVKKFSKTASIAFVVLVLLVGLFSFTTLSMDQSPLTERWSLTKSATEIFVHNSLIGVGLLQFIPSLPALSSPPYLLQPVHSIYLLIAAETGIVGFATFLFFMLFVVRHAFQQKKYHLVIVIMIILCCGLFDHYFITIQQTRLLFVLIVSFVFVNNQPKAPRV